VDSLFIFFTIPAHDIQGYYVENQGDHEQQQTQGKGGQGLGTVKFLVADQQGDDLYGNRGDGLQGID